MQLQSLQSLTTNISDNFFLLFICKFFICDLITIYKVDISGTAKITFLPKIQIEKDKDAL